jgi:S1-C subfamily serine protease
MQGEILTNSHVVENCENITVQFSSGGWNPATLVARDQRNDVAVIRVKTPFSSIATFRDGAPIRAGDTVVALGYPLSGLLSSNANLSVGNVSALTGLGDDSRYLQISAPVQPGNSGGPLLDASGHLIGVVTAKLNAVRVAKFTGDIPQNVNFALKAEVVRTFLDSKGIVYQKAPSNQQMSPADVGDSARPFTTHIRCEQTKSQAVAAIASPRSLTPSPDKRATLGAKWGCAARGPGKVWGDSSGFPSEARAREVALRLCSRSCQAAWRCNEGCRIVGCIADAVSLEQVRTLWPPPSSETIHCGGGSGQKC